MKMKKGFTLAEMVAVIAILMILAVMSAPFVRGYIDDAHNGKALIYMRELNEARMNFEKDYPGTTVVGTMPNAGSKKCQSNIIYSQTNLELDPGILSACKYVKFDGDILSRYSFSLGSTASCKVCDKNEVTAVASMLGLANSGIYENKCACIDSLGNVYREDND